MYEGDAPLAERRAQALSLDRSLLAEIMGHEELRELLDPAALVETGARAAVAHRPTEGRAIRTRCTTPCATLGDLTVDEIEGAVTRAGAVRSAGSRELERPAARPVHCASRARQRWIAVEDAARFRDALGAALPVGVPDAFLEPVADPLGDLVARFARTHGPFPARRCCRSVRAWASQSVERSPQRARGRTDESSEGEFRPGASGTEWIDVEVLRRLRRRSLAAYPQRDRACPPGGARALRAWHGTASARPVLGTATAEALLRTIEQLQGAPHPGFGARTTGAAGARLPGYTPALLDQLGAAGEVVWCGAGALGSDDGWIRLALADDAPLLLPGPSSGRAVRWRAAMRDALANGGALFFRQIADAVRVDRRHARLLLVAVGAGVGRVRHERHARAASRAVVGDEAAVAASNARAVADRRCRSRSGPPAGARDDGASSASGRTNRPAGLHALAEQLLERHGIVTRGHRHARAGAGWVRGRLSGAARRWRRPVVAGAATSSRVSAARSSRCPARSTGCAPRRHPRGGECRPSPRRHRPRESVRRGPSVAGARWWTSRPVGKPGAVVVLVGGQPRALRREGRTHPALLHRRPRGPATCRRRTGACRARRDAWQAHGAERADGEDVQDTPFAEALVHAGFRLSSRGLRLRA